MRADPGTGTPDGEARAVPHGDTLATALGNTATVGGLVLDNGGDGWHVAAYRSLAVVCVNSGVFPINVTVRWAFWLQATSAIYTEETLTVPALTHKRLLFQNEADYVPQITFTGVGGSSNFNHYIAGSNLDPFSGQLTPFLYLAGVTAGTQVVGSGVGFNAWFQQAGGVSYNSDGTIYEFNTISPGVTDTVDVLQQGLYLVSGGFLFEGPAAEYGWQGQIVGHNIDPVAPLMAAQLAGNDKGNVYFAAADLFRVGPASIGAGNNSIQVSGVQNSGGNVTIASAYLHIARLSATAP